MHDNKDTLLVNYLLADLVMETNRVVHLLHFFKNYKEGLTYAGYSIYKANKNIYFKAFDILVEKGQHFKWQYGTSEYKTSKDNRHTFTIILINPKVNEQP